MRRTDRIGRGRASVPRCRRLRPRSTSTAATSARETCASAASAIPITNRSSSSTTITHASAQARPSSWIGRPGIYRNAPATGVARVVCYSPKHNTTLAELPVGEIAALLGTWRDQYLELGARPEVRHVLTFENKGEVVGVSNPHPHGQIYATNFVFKTIETEAAVSRRHTSEHRRPLFQDIIRAEQDDGRRILFETSSAIVFLPYFARYAYECFVAPKETHAESRHDVGR